MWWPAQNRYEFTELAKTGDFDLILAETTTSEAGIPHIIQDIRNHRIGQDPFVNIVLFLWNSASELVGRGDECRRGRPDHTADVAGPDFQSA